MSYRLLVIEDEPEIADYLVRGLREEGFTVEHAADGETGWYALTQGGDWDVVLLDWWLPGQDGLAILKRYRRSGGIVPVLFMTARDSVPDRVQGLDGGADDYLCKPFAFDELLARIRALARRPTRNATKLKYQDVSVDLVTHSTRRAGLVLDLTAKEQSLLVYLLRHPGEVLSRTRIYEHVWDERYDGISNTLEVHVMELRRKLEAHGPRLIFTLRNRGYRFGDPPSEEGASA